jgi:two-component system phosphate regulon sensor histidine kinase PhoR
MKHGGRILAGVAVILLCVGAAIAWCEAAWHAPVFVPHSSSILLLLACLSFLATLVWERASIAHICRLLEAQRSQARPTRIDVPDGSRRRLTQGVNFILEHAEVLVADAALRRKELEIQLKVADAARQHAEAILYSISDAVLVTDRFDELLLANDSAARTFGFELARAVRTPVEKVVSDQTMVSLIREMRESHSINGRRIVEHTVKTGGGDRTFKVTLSCVTPSEARNGESAANGRKPASSKAGSSKGDVPRRVEPTGVVAVLQDVTKEKEVAEMKNDFVSNVSHELRTPLASIKAYVEMLIDGEADDEKTKREFYEVIQNEANRLGRLIDNILNISRIESGLVKISKQPQSLMVILKEAIEVISPQAAAKDIKIIEQLTPVFYQTPADKDMLYQAVLNLLSNAVKYTPAGGTITVATEVDEAKRSVTTRITDTGVGIPEKDLPFVFDKFYRAEANNRMAKGTGLGLSLVKHIIETVHEGRIFVESRVGKGTCFGFELELCK